MTERTNQTHPGLKIGFFSGCLGDFFVFIQPDINTERNRKLYAKIPCGREQTPNKPSIIPGDSLKEFRALMSTICPLFLHYFFGTLYILLILLIIERPP